MSQVPPSDIIGSPSQPFVYRFSSLSSASKDRYPDNRITKFVHHLPERLFFDKKKHYVIQLLSFCLSSKRLPDWKRPSYVRLHLSQLDQNPFAPPDQVRCLAQFVLPEKETGEKHGATQLDWFELHNPTPLVLNPTLFNLSELQFLFTDERNKELELDDGPPTILNCIIEEMDGVNRFCLTLNPSQSRNRFPDNIDVDFRVAFGSTLTTGTEWEVALHSVIVPSGIRVIGESYKYEIELVNGKSIVKRFKNTGQKAYDVLREMITVFAQYSVYISRDDRYHYQIGFEEGRRLESSMGKKVVFNPSLCKLFNIPNYSTVDGVIYTSASKILTFPIGANFERTRVVTPIEQVVLYADFVQSSVLGDERLPLVDILSTTRLGMLENSAKTDTLHTMTHATFRPISKAVVKDVRVKVCDIEGQLAEFEYDNKNAEIQFVFVFRK